MLPFASAWAKLGQPQPESNFAVESNSGAPQQNAAIDARIVAIPIRAGKRGLGPFFARDAILLRRENFLPLGLGFRQWLVRVLVGPRGFFGGRSFGNGHGRLRILCYGLGSPRTLRAIALAPAAGSQAKYRKPYTASEARHVPSLSLVGAQILGMSRGQNRKQNLSHYRIRREVGQIGIIEAVGGLFSMAAIG